MDIFQISEDSFNPMLLLPVLSIVVAIVAVFVFGFKKPENPNFRKIGNEHSSSAGTINNNNSKRQKRNVTAEATSPLQQQPKPTVPIKAVKKETAVAPVIEAKVALSNKTKTPAASKSQTKKSVAKVAKATNTKENKSNAKNTEKPLDDGGEWRTVVPKKQKKTATTNDLLIQAVAEAAAGASFAKSGANEKNKNLKNTNNNKQAKEQANKTKKATGEQQRVKEIVVVDNKSLEEVLETTNKTAEAAPVAEKTLIPEITPNVNVAPASKLLTEVADEIAVHAPKHTDTPAEDSNLVFDELGDVTWTDAKTPKKSKKRALRE